MLQQFQSEKMTIDQCRAFVINILASAGENVA